MANAPTLITLTDAQFQALLTRGQGPAKSNIPRPQIGLDATDEDWRLFKFQWDRYKSAAGLAGDGVTQELLSACSSELEKRLFQLRGPSLTNNSEEELLTHIKSMAVQALHTAVHRRQFHELRQFEGEDITQFVARLRSKAALCEFYVNAYRPHAGSQEPGPLSYEDDVLQTQLVVGLYNQRHQNEILSAVDRYTSFEAKFQALQSMQAAENSERKLHSVTDRKSPAASSDLIAAHVSQYQRQQRRAVIKPPDGDSRRGVKVVHCKWCGDRHKTNNPRFQDPICPARGKICDRCSKLNHFSSACRSGRQTQISSESADDVFASDASVHADAAADQATISSPLEASNTATGTTDSCSATHGASAGDAIPHMEWNGNEFTPAHPKSHPSLPITVTILHDSHIKLGKRLTTREYARVPNGARTTACADTGAMTCSSGPELLKLLHCPERYLLKTSHRIHGVTGTNLDVLGSLLLRIEVNGRVTKQVVYVSRNTRGIYLSERALRDLGVVPQSFPASSLPVPAASETASHVKEGTSGTTLGQKRAPCGCLERSTVPLPPDKMPYPATEANREQIEQWIKNRYASSAFNTCEHQPLQEMSGAPVEIHFTPDAVPTAVHTPIPIPHHWKKQVKADLDRDVRLGIIEPVPPGTPTRWCSRMVVAPKKDGSPRRTVNLTSVNEATLRETHHTPTPFNLVSDVPPGTKKSVLDAWNGYHSLPLAEQARDATTFITEFGRYRYKRAPQGFHASGDAYTRRMDDLTADVERLKRCVDDSLLWDQSLEDSFWHTVQYITLCGENGVVFNPSKFVFGADTVDFAGFTITPGDYKPTARLLSAIRDFPTPTNTTGIRSWFGLVNQVAYAFAQSKVMAPFRDLLKTKTGWKFYWDDTLDQLFQRSKDAVVRCVEDGVRSFEPHRPTCLSTDWSKTGIGFLLQQKHCQCSIDKAPHCGPDHWKLIFAGSRFLTEAESRYAPIEGEALALVYGLQQCRMFVLGCPSLTVAVDHKPLVKLFSDQSLENIKNPRLFSLKERSLMYRFRIKHVAGNTNTGPDAASRYPSPAATSGSTAKTGTLTDVLTAIRARPTDQDIRCADDLHESMVASAQVSPLTVDQSGFRAITWDLVKDECLTDSTSIELVNLIDSGFPDSRTAVPDQLKIFWPMRHELHHLEGVPFHDKKMFIPKSLRVEILDCLHSAHQGEVGMKNSARNRFFWPGMDAAITQKRMQCRVCQRISPSQPAEPPIESPVPEFPFEMVCLDYFEMMGHHYIIYVDRYSGWISITRMIDDTFKALAAEVRTYFGQWGVPQIIETDGGQPFSSEEFRWFLKRWGVKHRMSSAYFPQSNGRAELAVKTAKRLLQENTSRSGHLNTDQVTRALLQYRNTPGRGASQESPAQIIFGRPLRDGLPTPSHARPEWGKLRDLRERGHSRLHAKVTDRCLEPLGVGDVVLVQNQHGPKPTRWDRTGLVVETLGNRQYSVKMDGSGRITLRNRRFLKKVQPMNPACTPAAAARERVTAAAPRASESPRRITSQHRLTSQYMVSPAPCRPVQSSVSDAPREAHSLELSRPSPAASRHATPPLGPRGSSTQGQRRAPTAQVVGSDVRPPGLDAPRRSARARIPTRRLSMTPSGQRYTETEVTSIATLRF